MKKIFLLLLVSVTIAQAQKQNNIWYFGDHAGLDFNSGSPVSLSGSQIDTAEGCASISDALGNLLFYTDGVIVWNKNHVHMPNGTGLLGNASATQSAIIIPVPGTTAQYYIFTVDAQKGSGGFRYSKVDMLLNGGLGDVTPDKNILLLESVCEKLTAIKNQDGSGYWVMVHGVGNNTFFAYPVTQTGIQNAAMSNVGAVIPDIYPYTETLGNMKFSPDGTKIITANYMDSVQLLDFDVQTGLITNARTYDYYLQYGVEFSPTGNFVYISGKPSLTGNWTVSQFNISGNDFSPETVLYTGYTASLQLATDGKIYVSLPSYSFTSNYLAAIEFPDIEGIGCIFNAQKVTLNTGTHCQLGLPQCFDLPFNILVSAVGTCARDITHFSVSNPNIVAAVNWDFGDGETATDTEPYHNYQNPGSYMVTAQIELASGITLSKSINVLINPKPVAAIINDQEACTGISGIYTLSQNDTAILNGQDINNFNITYYLSEADASLGNNALNNVYTFMHSIILYARVDNIPVTECYAITQFSLLACKNIPKGISPNNDNQNETFNLAWLNVKQLTIFNRYGVEIFSMSNYTNEWHGQSNDGHEVPSGTYYYYIQTQAFTKTGWVYVNRGNP